MRRHELTATDLVGACIERIEAREPVLQALAYLDVERARAEAQMRDAAPRRGALHGIPVGVKDIFETADMPTRYNSPIYRDSKPTYDAACVARLREAGAVLLGKTVTAEFAFVTPGLTTNPHDATRSPGGSSSGSAAGVADFYFPLAIGSQTGGSTIRPASFCGVYGFKPTFGLVPRPGVLAQAPSLDTLGVFGRSIEDLALVGDVLQAYDPRDPASIAQSRPSLRSLATMAWPVAPTFAYVRSPAWAAADPRLHEAFGELVEALGDRVVEVDIDLVIQQGLTAARVIQKVELACHFGPVLDSSPGLVSRRLAGDIEEGRALKGVDYAAALAARKTFHAIVDDIFLNHGTILTPAAPGPAPEGLETTGNPVFNAFWTYLGVPAVTLPLLEADGLPIGVQLVGARRDDGRLLRTARLLVEQLAQGD